MSVGKDHVVRRNRTVEVGVLSRARGLGVIARCMQPSVGQFRGCQYNGNVMKMVEVKHNHQGCIVKLASTHAPACKTYKVRWNFLTMELPAVKMLRDAQA